jgi:cell division protein FtsX
MSRLLNFIVFLVVAGFAFVEFNTFRYLKDAEDRSEIRVFLEKRAKVKFLTNEITKEEGVKGVEYLSEEYALQEFKKEFNVADLVEMDVNPLPASFRVIMDRKHKNPQYLRAFSARVRTLAGVEGVVYEERYMRVVSTVGKYFRWLSWGTTGLLFLLVIFTVTMSVRHKLLILRNETALFESLGLHPWKLRLRLGLRAALENVGLSVLGLLIVYWIHHRFLMGRTLFFPWSLALALIAGYGVLTLIACFVVREMRET